jgi:acetolactate synthase-1/3 small subunit
VEKVINQIEKTVGVIRAFANTSDDIVYQEIALYKISTSIFGSGNIIEQLVREHNARILNIETDYIVIEKTGHHEETLALYTALESYGILGFVRSGRVALMKDMREIHDYIKELDEAHH